MDPYFFVEFWLFRLHCGLHCGFNFTQDAAEKFGFRSFKLLLRCLFGHLPLFQSVRGLFHFGLDVQLDTSFPNSNIAPDAMIDQKVC
jgi:hypothetical protein